MNYTGIIYTFSPLFIAAMVATVLVYMIVDWTIKLSVRFSSRQWLLHGSNGNH